MLPTEAWPAYWPLHVVTTVFATGLFCFVLILIVKYIYDEWF